MQQRIRSIKPEFFHHEDLFKLEQETELPIRLAFSGLWTCCDREGRFKWRPLTLKSFIMPYDDVDFSRVLDALATRGFIVRYTSKYDALGYIPTWHTHQNINNRESVSILPAPPEPLTDEQLDASATREAHVSHAPTTRLQGNRTEQNRTEQNGKEKTSAPVSQKKTIKKNRQTPPEEEIELPVWIKRDRWEAYLKMRKEIGKPATAEAQRLTIVKLEKFRAEGHSPDDVLNQSIERSWTGIFRPSADYRNQHNTSPPKAPTSNAAVDEELRRQFGESGVKKPN